MKKSQEILILIFILFLSIDQVFTQQVKLFDEGVKYSNSYFNLSLTNNQYKKRTLRKQAKSGGGRSVEIREFKYDTIAFSYLGKKNWLEQERILWDSVLTEIEILPERDTIIIRKVQEVGKTEILPRQLYKWENITIEFDNIENWKWNKTTIVRDTVKTSYDLISCISMIKLAPIKKTIVKYKPIEKIDIKPPLSNFTTLNIYKVSSSMKKSVYNGCGGLYETMKDIPVLSLEGGDQIKVETVSNISARKLIKNIKKKLKSLGFYEGEINDIESEKFKLSLMRYQEAFGLPIGQYDRNTISKLDLVIN